MLLNIKLSHGVINLVMNFTMLDLMWSDTAMVFLVLVLNIVKGLENCGWGLEKCCTNRGICLSILTPDQRGYEKSYESCSHDIVVWYGTCSLTELWLNSIFGWVYFLYGWQEIPENRRGEGNGINQELVDSDRIFQHDSLPINSMFFLVFPSILEGLICYYFNALPLFCRLA